MTRLHQAVAIVADVLLIAVCVRLLLILSFTGDCP
jgi:hypothetical protein